MPGLYELGLPAAAFAPGASHLVVAIRFDDAEPALLEIALDSFDPYEPFAMALGNFVRTVCHEHLTSVFYRVMPAAVTEMLDQDVAAETVHPRSEGDRSCT